MRILVCDSRNIKTFVTPSTIENNFIIDYKNNNVIESLTIEKKENKLFLMSGPNIQIKNENYL